MCYNVNFIIVLVTIKEQTNNPTIYLDLCAKEAFLNQRYDQYFLYTAQKIQNQKKYDNIKTFAEYMLPLLGWLGFPFRGTLRKDIMRFDMYQRSGWYYLAHRIVESLPKKYPENTVNLELLAGIFCRSLGEYKRAQQHFRSSLEKILENPARLAKVTQSRKTHVLLECKENLFTKDSYFFKRSIDPKALKREEAIASLQRDAYIQRYGVLNIEQVPCEDPLSSFPYGEEYILVTRRVNKKTLNQCAENNLNDFKQGITHLIQLMAAGTGPYQEHFPDEPVHDYQDEFKRRCRRRLQHSRQQEFLDQYERKLENLAKLRNLLGIEVLAHRDAAESNVLEGGYVIDWETGGRSDSLHDIAAFMAARPGQRNELLQHAWNEWKKYFPARDYQLWIDTWKNITIQNSLCQLAALSERRKPEDKERIERIYVGTKRAIAETYPELNKSFEESINPSVFLG